jgi:hypothetical protein
MYENKNRWSAQIKEVHVSKPFTDRNGTGALVIQKISIA